MAPAPSSTGSGDAEVKHRPVALHAMVVVQLGAAHADGDVQYAGVAANAALKRAHGGWTLQPSARHFVRHEVRRGVAFFLEGLKVTVQFVGEDVRSEASGRKRGTRQGPAHTHAESDSRTQDSMGRAEGPQAVIVRSPLSLRPDRAR